MSLTATEERVRDVVCGVVSEALRVGELAGCVLDDGASPEARLLTRWLQEAGVPVEEPDPALVRRFSDVFAELDPTGERGGAGEPSAGARALARSAAARAVATSGALLVLGTTTRTHLVLEGARAWTLPLGDLYGSEVAVWAGGVSMPAPLRGRDLDTLRAVDEALGKFLEGQRPLSDALAALPDDLRRELDRALRRGMPEMRPPLIPKLRRWTPGLDLAL